jgi:hypothetical protein
MMKELLLAAVLVTGGLALGGCPMGGAKTAAPAKKAPAPDYQLATAPAATSPNKAACYNDADLTIIRSRMFHQEMVVAVLQCQTAGGARAFEAIYTSYLQKFSGELGTNARALQQLVGRKRLNTDVVVTEFSNRMAQRAQVDREFCSRNLRALEWALDPKVASLAQTPPPYDLGPEMGIYPCTGS